MSRIFHLHKAIATLTQGVSPVSVYYSKLKDLWDEYDSITPPPACGCAKSKDYTDSLLRQKLLQFLMGLNNNYSQARSQILMMNPTPSVNQCYAMIIQDESQRVLSGEHCTGGSSIDPTALFSHRSGSSIGSGSYSNGIGYTGGAGGSGNSGSSSGENRPRRNPPPYCEFCNMRGHSKEACFKLLQCNYCNMKGHTRDTC